MSDLDLKFGIVGFGAWGNCHADAITATEGAVVHAIAAKSESTCDAARKKYPHVVATTDYRQLIRLDSIDVIDVVVPSHLHREVAVAALEAGKHVLLEKPMAITIEDCNAIVDAARANDRLLAVGHELRLSSMWKKVKDLIEDGYIGEPQYCLVELSRKPYRHGADGWRFDIDRVGNWILEEPIHFFDLARWYLSQAGNPTSVFARANSRQNGHPELQDNFSALMNFERGAYALITQTLSAFEHHQMAKVTGTEGAIWASWSGAQDRTLHPRFTLKAYRTKKDEVLDLTPDRITGEVFELQDQMAMMVNAVRDGKQLHATGDDGRWSVAMCIAAQQSVDTGIPVKITELP
ncbi:MAG: dehydrogenase [Planctomycetaceae bacterium]|nr:dehydrogenase [Planctomycetaceae bacterium]|tara:strand:+ start:5210 stop:6259 length:1050 start_codon:yes stop_codon:yes gene_type:complete